MSFKKSVHRVYFNRHQSDGLIWSVDEGTQDTEINVKDVVIGELLCQTKSGPGDNVKSPTAWIEVEESHMTVLQNVAHLFKV